MKMSNYDRKHKTDDYGYDGKSTGKKHKKMDKNSRRQARDAKRGEYSQSRDE